MPYTPRRQQSSRSSSSRDSRSRGSDDSYSYDSQSTAPTSIYTSGSSNSDHAEPVKYHKPRYQQPYSYSDDVSPDTSLYPGSSVDSLASTTVSAEDLDTMDLDEAPMEYEEYAIPALGPYHRRDIVEPNVRASTPQDFAKLFPSLNRFTIRHDEFTPDGNMNLRIDTVVTGTRRRTAIQLFHLRMHDLAKREFSLRRYCRDSGREVCNSKRKYIEQPVAKPKTNPERPTLKRSMSSAIKSLGAKPVLRRAKSGAAALGRPNTGYSTTSDGDDEYFNDRSNLSALSLDSRVKGKAQRPVPTNTIKLEFSNYARVDVHRRGGKNNKRYEFEWWGHRYHWKRAVDKQLGGQVSFHLLRDGNASAPVAHIVPETRSRNQVLADENAGGWVPPCFMWFDDETVVDAMTDVADVIMATGLMALVDDCIKERWATPKVHRIPVPLTHKTVNLGPVATPNFMQRVFFRRHSNDSNPPSPLRFAHPIAAY